MGYLERIALLLDILHKSASAGAQYSWISSIASTELARMQSPAPGTPSAIVPKKVEPTPAPEPESTPDEEPTNG